MLLSFMESLAKLVPDHFRTSHKDPSLQESWQEFWKDPARILVQQDPWRIFSGSEEDPGRILSLDPARILTRACLAILDQSKM